MKEYGTLEKSMVPVGSSAWDITYRFESPHEHIIFEHDTLYEILNKLAENHWAPKCEFDHTLIFEKG